MRERRSVFWYSFFLTLMFVIPMVASLLWFTAERDRQQALKQAAAPAPATAVEPGSQTVLRLLLAVQSEEPEFILLRVDSPARTITLCGVPGQTVVSAPAGETTLAAGYMAAGPARAAALLGDTLGLKPDGYFAATGRVWAAMAGPETTARLDMAAVLSPAQRRLAGFEPDPVADLTAPGLEDFLMATAQAALLQPPAAAKMRAAAWAAFGRQNPELAATFPAAMRKNSAYTLTSLTAQQLYALEEALQWLQNETAATTEYTLLPGVWRPVTGDYALNGDSLDAAKELLG